jgi:hypothetical protein
MRLTYRAPTIPESEPIAQTGPAPFIYRECLVLHQVIFLLAVMVLDLIETMREPRAGALQRMWRWHGDHSDRSECAKGSVTVSIV